ncbi:hypothetical protein OC846_000493 [Tilletia horrida]|uniref:Uncharacterized protein n=1 Tax=Tilletia horrida TaxID=155126 RepID=A0AAN6H0U4_9BASI|nr:hypothetical protein OC845_001105 [Tilletia horrida]KAK0557505.1 hypothetical protein OC846_000493 [Tilletia horrida]KAK0567878.1 hypothetical protein OC861_002438 [Tilletia horrida]
MASRGMQPGFLNAKGPGGRGAPARPQAGNSVVRFLQDEVFAPEKRPGNIVIAYGTIFFAASIGLIRTLGPDLLVPIV